MFETVPRCPGPLAGGVPAVRKIAEFFQGGVLIDGVVEAGKDGAAAFGHFVAEELPVAIGIMGDVGNGLFLIVDGLRKVGTGVRRVEELPAGEAAGFVVRSPEVISERAVYDLAGKDGLTKEFIEAIVFILKSIFEIGKD